MSLCFALGYHQRAVLVSVHREGVNPSSMDGVPDLRDHNSIKKILTKLNFKPILQFGSNNRVLTIQLFGPNYSNSSNSIRNPENERIRIPNTTIRS